MCSLCELSWPFGLQSWCPGSIYNNFFISGSKFIWHQWRQLLELEPLLFHLAISISDCLCLAHILEIRMNSLSVSFQDGSSCSYFSRKLFEFWAYANSLDHLDFSLAVFYNKNFISGSKFLYQSMKGMLELVLVLFLLAISISDYIYILLAHKVEIRMNSLSLSFSFRDGNSSSYFLRKLFKFWAYAISLVFFRKQIFISLIINEGSC